MLLNLCSLLLNLTQPRLYSLITYVKYGVKYEM